MLKSMGTTRLAAIWRFRRALTRIGRSRFQRSIQLFACDPAPDAQVSPQRPTIESAGQIEVGMKRNGLGAAKAFGVVVAGAEPKSAVVDFDRTADRHVNAYLVPTILRASGFAADAI